MYGTKAAFDYIFVGGRCAYETNKVFEFPKQSFNTISSLYITEHDNVCCVFMDTSSYLEVLFDDSIDSSSFYMLRLVYYIKNVDSLKLKIAWKKDGDFDFCDKCYENVILEKLTTGFLYSDIDLRQNAAWVGKITNIRLCIFNDEIVPLFIRYFSVYSPIEYRCSKPTCPYYSKYSYMCSGGKDLHILLGKFINSNNINISQDSSFLFNIYGIDFVVEFVRGYYFLDEILSKLNSFFDSMPIPCLKILKDGNKIRLNCDYTKPEIVYTDISEKLGFFNSDGSISYTYIVESSGKSDYIDVAGNLKGIYKTSDLKSLDFNKVFSVGFSDSKDLYPESSFEFLNKTVIFYTIGVNFDGYLNCFEIYCKALSGGGKILIYRKNKDVYEVVNSYFLSETNKMSKHILDWVCRVYRGDVIGFYNLKIGISRKADFVINYYGVVSGYSDSINKSDIEETSFSSVSFYAYFKAPTNNDIPILAVYNETSYVDKLSFLLEYSDSYDKEFNIIFNNNFNYKILGCQLNVKDDQGNVTEIPGEIVGIDCLSDNILYADVTEIELDNYDYSPPIDLTSIKNKNILRYSWNDYIINVYEYNNYTCSFIPGSVLFYYEFPVAIDICSVLIYSTEEESFDNYLLEILDNTKTSPSFSNIEDVIISEYQIDNWKFDIKNEVKTKGVGVFVYNNKNLPNISFSEIEICTKTGNMLAYVVDVCGFLDCSKMVMFDLNNNGDKKDIYIGTHIKSLVINVCLISNDRVFNLDNINVYSSFVPDDYFVSSNESGEGVLTIYNTRIKPLNCYLLDYTADLLDSLVYEYDFDNDIVHKGFVPTKYTHSEFYFVSSNYINSEYNTYSLKNLLNLENFFVSKYYNFKTTVYDDWYAPYDYLVPGKDGEFVYIDGGLKLRPLKNEAIRWFNYINVNEFYNDMDIELRFNYVGNIEDFVYVGLACCDRNYNNYLRFYSSFQLSPEYGLEFKLENQVDPTYYNFSNVLGRNVGLKIKKRDNAWTFYCFYSDKWHELTTFSLFDTEVLVAISTIFNAPHVKGNIIAEFISCEIKASKVVSGKKIWYTVNDGLSYVYSGNVLDNSTILDNFNKSLTFCRDYTVKKFVYNFNNISLRYLKFVNESSKSIKVTEIKCYIDDVLIPIRQGYVSYSDDLYFGILSGKTSYLDDDVVINYDLSHSIQKGGDGVLSAVGVDFGSNCGVNRAVIYYISETGSYEPCTLMYSYDNITYYDVYDNFSLFSKNAYTTAHYLFNEFVGYKSKNEIAYMFTSNDQYSADFSEEGVLDYKWIISSPYEVDSGGVWLEHLGSAESLRSRFSIDGDFIIDVYFDGFSNYSSGEASVVLKAVFKNNTYYNDVYVKHRFDNHRVYASHGYESGGVGSVSGGLRIERTDSVFYFYYRKYGTTWCEIGSYDYGYDYIYPVDVKVYLYGDNSFSLRIKKILLTKGVGIADTDLELLESPGISTLFVRGRKFINEDSYGVVNSELVSKLDYPFSFSWIGGVSSSIPAGGFLINKPYSIGLTYKEKDLSLCWFSEYFVELKIDSVLSYSSDVNTISSVSVGNYNIDKQLFTNTSDQTIKAIYKSRYDVNTIIDETFKAGEGTFNTSFSGSGFVEYMSDDFTGNDGDLYDQTLWSGSTSNIEIKNNKLHVKYCAEHIYIDTKYTPVGDFNVQVDFELGNYYYSSELSQQLVIYFENGNRFDIRRQGTHSNCGYKTTICIDGDWTTLAQYAAQNDDFGKIRIIKKENIFSSYFLQKNQWFRLVDWMVPEDVNVSYIRLEHSSWDGSSKLECYFDNFVINDDLNSYCDVVIDGNYSYVNDNYIKLEGGNIRTNKIIRSAGVITFECSFTIEDYNNSYSAGFVVCNTPFRSAYYDHTGESIYISYDAGVFRLYIDGYSYSRIYDGDNRLFYPVYGRPYMIGVKFVPGTGTIIYWQGPTNGYLVLDYIINGDLYAWWGNLYGKGTYGNQVTTVHRFRCFEDRILYRELKRDWLFSVGANDNFNLSDGRSPNLKRWAVSGDPRIYNSSLKLMSVNGDKIQSNIFFCAPFEVVLSYNDLSFDFVNGLALSLNVEAYDSYKDRIFGVSKFKVGYNDGTASWVNYYCSGSSGNSSIYHVSNVSNRKLKIINDGYNIQYFLSDGDDWIVILSQDCAKQYYYKVSVEGTGPGVIAYLDSITVDSEEFMTPADAVALVPTAWKFSPTNKAYQDIIYVNLNELVDKCRYFFVDSVVKIDNSIFLSYIEINEDLVKFDGAKVVGDNYITLTSAISEASNGEIIYVLPGTYSIGGYTISKNIIIIGVGNYSDINIVISGSSVKLNGCEVIFKNITITEQLPTNNISFRTQGDKVSYFTMDNCRYVATSSTYVFKIEGTRSFYVYLRKCYFSGLSSYRLAYTASGYLDIMFDILNCRINLSRDYLLKSGNGYQMRSEIYSDSSLYEPIIMDTIPVFVLFSPHNDTNIYLNTPNGLEKIVRSKKNAFNYLSFGNTPGGVTFYGGDNNYYFSEYFMPPVDASFKLFIQGYVDTIRVFDRYQTYNETLNNINIIDNLGISLKLAHNNTIVDYKIYEPINQYSSSLIFGRNTPSIIDEFIWSNIETSSSELLLYYNSYLEKLGYTSCSISDCNIKYKFFIDFGSNVGVGFLTQQQAHNFSNVMYYSDNIDNPCLLTTQCSLSDARWYVLSNNVSKDAFNLDPGVFSVFPTISGCEDSRWEYTGDSKYIDLLSASVLSVSSTLTDVYNVKWKRNKTDINDYMVSSFSDSLVIHLKLFGGGVCDRIVIKSGYNVGTEYAGYITKCSIVMDSVTVFDIEDNINSTIIAEFDSVSFTTIDLIIYETKQVSEFFFNNNLLSGNVVFIEYIKILSFSNVRKFDNTFCNIYELDKTLALESINYSETGVCQPNYYFSKQFVNECVSYSVLDLDSLPAGNFTSVLAKTDGLYDCGFIIDEYTVSVSEDFITASVDSWRVYFGDVELYEEFFYIKGCSTSIGVRFFKNTVFEVGTYYEKFGMDKEWSITDELVLRIYSSNNVDNFYLCIGDKRNGTYYRWNLSLMSGWNTIRLNFYSSYVIKYVFNVVTDSLLFNDLDIFNVWFGGIYLHELGILVLDNIFVDKSSVKNVLSSNKDAFCMHLYYESDSGSVQLDYITYWDSDGKIFGNILSDKVLLSVFSDELCFSLVNKLSGEFVLGVYSYKHDVRTVKKFGKACKFNVNDRIKLKLDWFCKGGCFWSELYVNGFMVGRIQFNIIEIMKLKVFGVMVGGSPVYITSIYNSLGLCGQVNYIKIHSRNRENLLVNDKLFVKHGNEYKNLVESSPLYVGEIQPAEYIKIPIRYEGKSKELNQLNLKIKWSGVY